MYHYTPKDEASASVISTDIVNKENVEKQKALKTSVSRTLDKFWISPSDPPGIRNLSKVL